MPTDTGGHRRVAGLHSQSELDFTLDAPERGADESPTREMPPRDEPTVESELMNFADSPTTESPALKTAEMKTRRCADRSPRSPKLEARGAEGGSNRRGVDR